MSEVSPSALVDTIPVATPWGGDFPRCPPAWILVVSVLLSIIASGCEPEPPLQEDSADAGGRADKELDSGAPRPDAAGALREAPVFEAVHISSNPDAEFFQRATTEVDFGTEPVAHASLLVQLQSPCYPFEGWTRESIPDGHNWPLLCDAFDRTFLFSLDDPQDRDGEPPGLELVRAITPFGGPEQFEVDITDVVNGRPGVHELSVDIQTYGDPDGIVSGAEGEWIVTARLQLLAGTAPRKVRAVESLLFGFEQDAKPEPVTFTTPPGTTSGRIEYRATGHGGGAIDADCIGPAEEFCQRTHTLLLDGDELEALRPWRDDCDTLCTLTSLRSASLTIDNFCLENPTGAIESVRAPRANWCPGSITPPFVLQDAALADPGQHELSIEVNRVADGGLWLLSATYFAYE